MINLNIIQQQKMQEVATLKAKRKSLKQALTQPFLGVIAEIKRQSPSKGVLASELDPAALTSTYVNAGACAISVLTDQRFFGAKPQDLMQVAQVLKDKPQPILRKDFMIDEIQIAESLQMGADAILCIVAMLKNKTAAMLQHAYSLGLEVLVEVHNRQELTLALDSGAQIIGINNRNLDNFKTDINIAAELIQYMPKQIIKVAESGIQTPFIAKQYHAMGFDAVLIGEALVTAENPGEFIQGCCDD